MITKEQFAKAMLYLGMTYNKEIQQGTIKIWYEFFKDMDIETLMTAIKKICVKSKFLPTVAEIVEECQKIEEEFKYKILLIMLEDGYFKRCVVGEQSSAEEMSDYNKAVFMVGRNIIPEWLLEDMIKYGYKKPIASNLTQRISDNHRYLIE